MIDWKKLIEMWYEPNKWFTPAIKYINDNELCWSELIEYLTEVSQDKTIPIFKEPIKYDIFINAETAQEEENVKSVIETMDEVMKTPTVISGAIMPDSCPAWSVWTIPVWWVVTTKNAIHPWMHSADICCSVMATNFWKVDPKELLDKAQSIAHFWFWGRQDTFNMSKELEDSIDGNSFLNSKKMKEYAKYHLGTQWDWNHFLFVWVSKNTWDTYMVTHHWSRGFGAGLYKQGMKIAEDYRKEFSPQTLKVNAWIPADSKDGIEYWEALQIIREWTKENHTVLHDAIWLEVYDRFWNEHNFVFKDGESYIHAKWSTPLDNKYVPDSKDWLRLIPLNISEPILVVKWEWFAPHWAGRNMSRTQHMKNMDGTPEEILEKETQGLDIRFFGAPDISELPSAYKNAESLKNDIKRYDLAEIVDEIIPYGCIMAGEQKKPWEK